MAVVVEKTSALDSGKLVEVGAYAERLGKVSGAAAIAVGGFGNRSNNESVFDSRVDLRCGCRFDIIEHTSERLEKESNK